MATMDARLHAGVRRCSKLGPAIPSPVSARRVERTTAMTTINTATGSIDSSQLGFTLMHEHIYVLSEGVVSNFPHLFDRKARLAQAVAALKDAKAHGVSTVVDLTVLGLGRDVAFIRDIAREAGINVIVATGLYTY